MLKLILKQKHKFCLKKNYTHTSTRVTLDGQITLYLYIVSRVANNLCVVCETFARKHKCLIIQ